jgi:7-cyano-7-deazaguanine synthase
MSSILLFSGGMDSMAIAAWKSPDWLLTIDYGQRPFVGEARAAAAGAKALGIQHETVGVPLAGLGSGDLAGERPLALAPASDWWPFRNQFLITIAASRALVLGASELLIGTVRSDGVHADGRHGFVDAMAAVLAIQEGAVRLSAPAIGLSTAELVRLSRIDLTILAWAHSCHLSEWACGQCRGCNKHRDTWLELGRDPY